MLTIDYVAWGAHAYAGNMSGARTNPYVTSLGNPFPTPVPLFVNVGTAELFFERITLWATEMREITGNVVELHNEEGAVHDTFFAGELLGFQQSAWEVAARVAEFVQKF